jgi:hypothetical protein
VRRCPAWRVVGRPHVHYPSGFEHRDGRIDPHQEGPSAEQPAYARGQLPRHAGLLGAVVAHDQPARRPGPCSAADDQGGVRSKMYDPLRDAAHDQAFYRPQPPAADHHQADAQLLGQPGDLLGGAACFEVGPAWAGWTARIVRPGSRRPRSFPVGAYSPDTPPGLSSRVPAKVGQRDEPSSRLVSWAAPGEETVRRTRWRRPVSGEQRTRKAVRMATERSGG